MGLPSFKKVAGATPEQIQDRLREFFQPIATNPLLDGILLTGVDVGTVPTNIPHKLGREALGWIVVGKSADARVWAPSAPLPKSYLTLQASSPCVVSLWVF